jgi:hypothetical protein
MFDHAEVITIGLVMGRMRVMLMMYLCCCVKCVDELWVLLTSESRCSVRLQQSRRGS